MKSPVRPENGCFPLLTADATELSVRVGADLLLAPLAGAARASRPWACVLEAPDPTGQEQELDVACTGSIEQRRLRIPARVGGIQPRLIGEQNQHVGALSGPHMR